MADITIRKTNGNGQHLERQQQPHPSPPMMMPGGHPLRWMRDLMKWDPFSAMAPMAMPMQPGVIAAFDVKETPAALIFKADLPGFSEKDLDITAVGNRLTISGTRTDEREEKGDTFYVAERRHGRFTRSFTLPQGVDVDKVTAELKQGVLTVTVPRAVAGQAKKIAVKAATPKS